MVPMEPTRSAVADKLPLLAAADAVSQESRGRTRTAHLNACKDQA
jgi:hypothetical protein